MDHIDVVVVVGPGPRKGRPQVRPELWATEAVDDEVDGGVQDDEVGGDVLAKGEVERGEVEVTGLHALNNRPHTERERVKTSDVTRDTWLT